MQQHQMDRLAKLNELRSAGALTDAEFEREKSNIFDRRHLNPLGIAALTGGLFLTLIVVGVLTYWMTNDITQRDNAAQKIRKSSVPIRLSVKTSVPDTAAVQRPVSLPDASNKWAGRYQGKTENANATMTIKNRPGGKVFVDLGVGSPRCLGGISFNAVPNGNLISHREPYDAESQQSCKMTLVRNGLRVVVEENECSSFHGFECSFNGTLAKRYASRQIH
ncbi:SHOCT domain-containing protein [Sphingomonas sp. AAP5]|uniref:SHOCT domain-containing protein n=1 Tax=Sphingomonas sp. AAP5 TaxID=1523415 RepID=UPI001056FED5|nr:SHOCT domain-containing protein [Sphingomonas sp. AAP5]QBM77410.1 SHOCT domain-containing protein [Sphingomonas sp. AAP5]